MDKENKKELAYYFVMFKMKGHSTWRAQLGADRGAFERYAENNKFLENVTDKKEFRVDRITGEVTKA